MLQIAAVPSADDVIRYFPSGLNAAPVMGSWCRIVRMSLRESRDQTLAVPFADTSSSNLPSGLMLALTGTVLRRMLSGNSIVVPTVQRSTALRETATTPDSASSKKAV